MRLLTSRRGGESGRRLVARRLARSLTAAALFASASASFAGTVTINSQTRTITATAAVTPGVPALVDTRTAPSAGSFDAAVAVDAGTADTVSRADASLNSTLGQDGFVFAGSLAYDVRQTLLDDAGSPQPGVAAGASVLGSVQFFLDAPYRFEATYDVQTLAADPERFVDTSASSFGDIDADFPEPGESSSGVLAPGNYLVTFARSVEGAFAGPDLRTHDETYRFAFNLSPVDDGGGGGEPNPIPLPPAVGSALPLLLLLGGSGLVARIRHVKPFARVITSHGLGPRARAPAVEHSHR